MKKLRFAIVLGLLASGALFGQHTVVNCGLPNNPNPDCYLQDSATIGGVRYEDDESPTP